MFFLLSKTLNYLTMPLVIICLLFLFSWVLKSKKKALLFKIGFALLLLFSNDFITNEVIRLWELPATPFQEIKKKYAIGILLTGVTKGNMVPDDRVYFHRGADRVTHTLQLYRLGIIDKILISGGSGSLTERRTKEADEIADALKLMGVAGEDLIIENESRNTHESAVATKKVLQDSISSSECLLITSAFHMRRSRACFAKIDWPCDTFTTDFLIHERKFTPDVLVIPRLDSLQIWHIMIREWVGMVAYKLSGYI
ncbi:MAG: YdcF family protein [Cyclobacteriaceae bacterium]|nr:YdcF family protein [Cyclobacteriaceae bacterium]